MRQVLELRHCFLALVGKHVSSLVCCPKLPCIISTADRDKKYAICLAMDTQSNFSASDMAWLRAAKIHGDYQRGRTNEGIAFLTASLPFSETK